MAEATLKLIFALITFLIILLGGWYPFKKRVKHEEHHDFPIGETLATGVFLGAALLHMLPESGALFLERGYHYPWAYLITGAVFLFFLWFEHLGKELYQHHNASHPAFAILAWGMLSIHSIMLGTALGLNHSNSVIIMLFLAIITHKWAESFAIAVQLNKSTLSRRQSICFFLSFSLMTPLGILIGWYFGHGVETNSIFDPVLIAASAGTFLYLGTLHGLEQCVMVERCCNLRDFSFVIIGFGLMAAVASYV
ncbi:ZIP zinc/iron transport family protein [Legionella massiliensis]|uniref:ZIP zinc/iron transport family protein n=1 Tax=Legionella massiliensis TaxID=1034943 RepID=A0A078L0Z4_9GAMM|nr:ZIP zinc/iron transport family protein [Legionella massiliensis]CEE13447.1 ZIP Zinc transporter [Legionella massiliensis]